MKTHYPPWQPSVHDYHQEVHDYIDGVLGDEIPAGRLVKLACSRHLTDLKEAHHRGLYFDEKKASEACAFFPMALRHSTGEFHGNAFHLTPPQAFIVWCVHGWQRRDGNVRRFTRAHIEVARKFGKSEMASGLALRHAKFDNPFEAGAEVYLAATKEDQVKLTTFKTCRRMVQASPALKNMRCRQTIIQVPDNDPYQPGSFVKPLGSDSDSNDGLNLHAAVLDELHAWKRYHQGFYERMTTAGGARRQEMVWMFTTAGDDQSMLWIQLREMAIKALESYERKDHTLDSNFAFIACIDDEDDPLSYNLETEWDDFEWTMRKANPNYPTTPKRKYLKDQAREAQASPLQRQKFMRFMANVQTSSSTKPFPTSRWTALQTENFPAPGSSVGAFDLGRSDDFSAWAVVWQHEDTYYVRHQAYTCEGRPEMLRTTEIASWIKQGFLTEHPGDQVDQTMIMQDILDATEDYDIHTWVFDSHFATKLAQDLQAHLGTDAVLKWPQNAASYNEPCRTFEKLVRAKQISVPVDACLTWQAGNLAMKADSQDRWIPEKGISRERKIDSMVAILMAFGQHLLRETEAPPSYYDDNELEMF